MCVDERRECRSGPTLLGQGEAELGSSAQERDRRESAGAGRQAGLPMAQSHDGAQEKEKREGGLVLMLGWKGR